jgi:hypothetical protein
MMGDYYEDILFEVDGLVAAVTINRPQGRSIHGTDVLSR